APNTEVNVASGRCFKASKQAECLQLPPRIQRDTSGQSAPQSLPFLAAPVARCVAGCASADVERVLLLPVQCAADPAVAARWCLLSGLWPPARSVPAAGAVCRLLPAGHSGRSLS